MQLVAAFNPILSTSGSFIASTLQSGSKMIVINKSYVDVLFTFPDGNQRLIIANDRRAFTFNNAYTSPTIQWSQQNIDYPQTIIQLENIVYVEIYDVSEIVSETYPSNIVRETRPNVLPYNIGHASFSQQSIPTGTSVTRVVFPSSYLGVAVAPPFPNACNGIGFDFYYLYFFGSSVISQPGGYATATGKVANNATLAAGSNTIVPGPFSLPGLAPKDTAGHFNNSYYTLATAPAWTGATGGFYIEALVNFDNAIGSSQYIYADNEPLTNHIGVECFTDSLGMPAFRVGNGTSTFTAVSTEILHSGVTYHLQFVYTGNITNTIQIWINGILQATTIVTGTITTSTLTPRIGSNPVNGGTFNGSISHLAINLSGPPSLLGTAAARYEHFQQSLLTDMQSAFITKLRVESAPNAAHTGTVTVTFGPVFNPAGLLYALSPASSDALHIYPNNIFQHTIYTIPSTALDAVYTVEDTFPQPLMTYDSAFAQVSIGNTLTTDSYLTTISGYNILGMN